MFDIDRRAAISTRFWFEPWPFRNSIRVNPWWASDVPTSVQYFVNVSQPIVIGAGEVHVMRVVAVRDRGQQDDLVGRCLRRAPADLRGDPEVRVDRQVRAVVLERGDRDQRDAVLAGGAADLGPRQPLVQQRSRPHLAHAPPLGLPAFLPVGPSSAMRSIGHGVPTSGRTPSRNSSSGLRHPPCGSGASRRSRRSGGPSPTRRAAQLTAIGSISEPVHIPVSRGVVVQVPAPQPVRPVVAVRGPVGAHRHVQTALAAPERVRAAALSAAA